MGSGGQSLAPWAGYVMSDSAQSYRDLSSAQEVFSTPTLPVLSEEEMWVTVCDWLEKNRSLVFHIAIKAGYRANDSTVVQDDDIMGEATLIGKEIMSSLTAEHRIDLFAPCFIDAWKKRVRRFLRVNEGIVYLERVFHECLDIDHPDNYWKHTHESFVSVVDRENAMKEKLMMVKDRFAPILTNRQSQCLADLAITPGMVDPELLNRVVARIKKVCRFATVVTFVATLSFADPAQADILTIEEELYSYHGNDVIYLAQQPMHVIAEHPRTYSLAGPSVDTSSMVAVDHPQMAAFLNTGTQESETTAPNRSVCGESTVLFPLESSVPEPGRLGFLEQKLQGCQEPLEVVGHTCDLGSEKYNLELSQRRAHVVSDHLKKSGHQIHSVSGVGETDLVSKDPLERFLSRRVVVTPHPSHPPKKEKTQ